MTRNATGQHGRKGGRRGAAGASDERDEHVTDMAGRQLSRLTKPLARSDGPGTLGLSPNPATNMFMADIAMRGISQLMRNTVHKSVLQNRYDDTQAKRIVEKKSILRTLALAGASRVATRSVPGAALVGGTLLAKALYERSQARRKGKAKAQREGEDTLASMAD
ncbi:hypothetical protein EYB45_00465 [Erythrobacteraceae bacterium CFH 75059]|uniref:hypothetical protein n=1 Tax=Qipengyuania thermophila TaxID=2509361 RepID=UPI001022137F|nr:hypothetical protein [Qipengyuania thermophila]TCD06254.1 hypothetical protein EYB45_00465 [Erythrobacteraceae bacterium CFH 75059]